MKIKDLSRPLKKIGKRFSTLKKIGQAPGSLIYTGKSPLKPPEIELLQYNTEQLSRNIFRSVESMLKQVNEKYVNWIHLNNLNNTALIDEIGTIFKIHVLTLEDILNTDHLPKVEESDDYLFLTLKHIQFDESGELTETHISLILCDNVLLTFADSEDDIFNIIKTRIESDKSRARAKKADYLFYLLMDNLVDNYYLVFDKLYERLEKIDIKLIETPGNNYINEIHQIKNDLVLVRKSLFPLEKAVGVIIKDEFDLIDDEDEIFFKDVNDHIIQLVQTHDSYRDFITSLIEINSSNMNNVLNRTMKILTVIATIFIPLTFVAGIYGMNFKNMPELSWRYGYFMVLGLMFLIAIGMFFYMKRKKFL
ncbi:MAG: magnesium/cobalt transporter CorA [Bacteroidales bacterium]|nr:magnesium/cobalt transporter CorA [Bacteroidales bacterium]